MTMHKLLYLHGFSSSPQSLKAQLISQYMSDNHCLDNYSVRKFLQYLKKQDCFLSNWSKKRWKITR